MSAAVAVTPGMQPDVQITPDVLLPGLGRGGEALSTAGLGIPSSRVQVPLNSDATETVPENLGRVGPASVTIPIAQPSHSVRPAGVSLG